MSIKKTIVIGSSHLVQLPDRVIFAGTHHSYADVLLIRHSLIQTPARKLARRLVVATASDGFGSAGLLGKYGVLAFGLFPFRRNGSGRESVMDLAAIAGAGNPVLIFCQGTHARPEQECSNDRSVSFRIGTALLTRESGAVVVPFGLAGTEAAMPPFLEDFHGTVVAGVPVSLRRVPLAIVYGKPMVMGAGESLRDFTNRLQETSYALTRHAEAVLARGPRSEAAFTGADPPVQLRESGR